MRFNEVTDSADSLAVSDRDPVSIGVDYVRVQVCKACGRVLDTGSEPCDGVGPHAPVVVDARTIVRDVTTGRVIRAVHLE